MFELHLKYRLWLINEGWNLFSLWYFGMWHRVVWWVVTDFLEELSAPISCLLSWRQQDPQNFCTCLEDFTVSEFRRPQSKPSLSLKPKIPKWNIPTISNAAWDALCQITLQFRKRNSADDQSQHPHYELSLYISHKLKKLFLWFVN
jgi:hypothetical protein